MVAPPSFQATLPRSTNGMTLIELVITMALSALLILGLVKIASAASFSTQLQRNQAQLQENARLAIRTLSRVIRQTGFNPRPWSTSFPPQGLSGASQDHVSSAGDRLVIRSWSDLNCFSNRNPETDSSGSPLYYIKESAFDLNSTKGLTRQCRYGPSQAELVTQVRRQGLIQGVESFQLQFGDDSDQDGAVDTWVKAGHWSDPDNVMAIRVGLLLSGEDRVVETKADTRAILDSMVHSVADGKLRRTIQFTTAFRGRTG